MKLFTTAFIQVFLVSVNVYFISHVFYAGVALVAFGISWFWAGNVKTISISGNKESKIASQLSRL
jgi:hypothetical protein